MWQAVAKVTTVYRRRYCIHVDRIIKEKTNGAQVPVPIHPSKVQITKLKLDKDRKALIERKKVVYSFHVYQIYTYLYYTDIIGDIGEKWEFHERIPFCTTQVYLKR